MEKAPKNVKTPETRKIQPTKSAATRVESQASALVVLAVPLALLQTKGQTPAPQPAASAADPHRTLLNTYCVTCHNARLKTGGLVLDGLNLETAADDAQIWEKALRKMRGRLMPPPGAPQPSQKEIDSFSAWMENTLDTQAKGPRAGYVPVQRLNRTEYAAAIKTLVGVEVSAKDVLPQDIQVEGFDNIAAALTVSPSFVDQYISAARQVARMLALIDGQTPRHHLQHLVSAKIGVFAERLAACRT